MLDLGMLKESVLRVLNGKKKYTFLFFFFLGGGEEGGGI